MPDAYVELVGIHKSFADLAAVADVNLAAPEGKVTTLLGPSGCGKTTLLRLIAGFLQPDRGEIRINGRRVNEVPPQRRSTVIVFQDYALFPHLSVFDNVAYGLRRRRVSRSEIARRVDGMLAFLGLAGAGRQSPLQLSGGQQQRVALARALVVEPDVLLLDEPLSNLDAKLRVRVRTELKEIQRSLGKTTILVTHDQEEALSISDRIAVIESGRIRQVGTPFEVYSRPADRFVGDFVGIANFVPAIISGSRAGELLLDSPLGRAVSPGESDVGEVVTLVVCPAALRISLVPREGRVEAEIRSTSFLGAVRRHFLELGDLSLVADQPVSEAEPEASSVWLDIDPAAGLHVLPGPVQRLELVLDRGAFRRQAEGVPPEGMEDVVAFHHAIAGHRVADAVVAEMPDVDVARRIGEHLEHIVFLLGRLGRVIEFLARPALLPFRFEGLRLVFHRSGDSIR